MSIILAGPALSPCDLNPEALSGSPANIPWSGCACDIPSVTYQYTWEPKVWSKYYSEVRYGSAPYDRLRVD